MKSRAVEISKLLWLEAAPIHKKLAKELHEIILREDRKRRQMERAIMMRKLDDRPLEKIARRLDKRKGDKHG